jgi:1-deoxy-D-xylulose-5-phosphate reductoisomerase
VKKRIAILGSTGSIGTQALAVIAANTDLFEVEVLIAQSNASLLITQAIEFVPNVVVIGDETKAPIVKQALAHLPIKVYSGPASTIQVVQMDTVDLVLTAVVGFAGLEPTMAAISAGKNIALANKETLVVAGDIVTQLARTFSHIPMPGWRMGK